MRSLMICTFTQFHSGDQLEKNEMGGACSTYGWRGEMHTGFWWGKLREREQLEDPGIDGRIVLKKMFRKWNVRAWPG
jgi:hypothetical protein